MKALEKDRNRRYETAAALATDVRHYLNDEPVLAMAPSRLYRASKFIRRNKAPVIASAAVLAGMIAAVVGMALVLVSQSRQRAEAERAQSGDRTPFTTTICRGGIVYREGLQSAGDASAKTGSGAARTSAAGQGRVRAGRT